ncbi:MAG: nucleotidyltransferase family protein [Phycisphaerae bacterium]
MHMTGSPANKTRSYGGSKALLLAGGVGARLRPLTDRVPKCLIPIAGRPLLDYWFDALAVAGIEDVLINTHHLADQVRRYVERKNERGEFKVVEAYEPELLGSAGTVHANRNWVDDADQCLIIYADNLSNVSLVELLRYHGSHDDPMTMMLFQAAEPKRSGIVELDNAQRVVSFTEKPQKPKSDLANAGLYVLTADACREIADMNVFDFGFDVLPKFVGRMRGWTFEGYHRDIGTSQALREAELAAPRVFAKVKAKR